jgi:hypothetical protein
MWKNADVKGVFAAGEIRPGGFVFGSGSRARVSEFLLQNKAQNFHLTLLIFLAISVFVELGFILKLWLKPVDDRFAYGGLWANNPVLVGLAGFCKQTGINQVRR